MFKALSWILMGARRGPYNIHLHTLFYTSPNGMRHAKQLYSKLKAKLSV
jgi:hypothetical protein